MNNVDQSQFFEQVLFLSTGQSVDIKGYKFVSGGCINNTIKLETDVGNFFLKWQEGSDSDQFAREVKGLTMLRDAAALNIPEVLGYGVADQKPYLLLEFIESGRRIPNYWSQFGQRLANLHRVQQASYGLDHDNYIGRLPQKNTNNRDWVTFFIENRLEVQLSLAVYNKVISDRFASTFRKLYARLPEYLVEEPASLLHGDLWSGNVMTNSRGEVTLVDPAVYYGNREVELAYTHMFGGFEREFYEAYHQAYPLQPGFDERIELYNLYPLLVHVNLFGTSYLSGVERTLRRYL